MLHPGKVGGLAKGIFFFLKAAEAKLSTILYLSTSQATLVLSFTFDRCLCEISLPGELVACFLC